MVIRSAAYDTMVNHVPYVFTCPKYLVPLLFSCLTYYVPYIFLLLHVFSWLTCLFCLLLCWLQVLISIFVLFVLHVPIFYSIPTFEGVSGNLLQVEGYMLTWWSILISDMICLNYFQKKYPDTNLYSECLSTYLVFDRNSCFSVKLYWSKLVIPPANFQFWKFLETFACSWSTT